MTPQIKLKGLKINIEVEEFEVPESLDIKTEKYIMGEKIGEKLTEIQSRDYKSLDGKTAINALVKELNKFVMDLQN